MVTKQKLNSKAILLNTQRLIADGKATVDLPRELSEIYDNDVWMEWTDSLGKPFAEFKDALHACQPYGLGVGQYNKYISATQLMTLCKSHEKLYTALVGVAIDDIRPAAKHGGDRTKQADRISLKQTAKFGTSNEYLIARMKREADNGNKKAIDALEGLRTGRLTHVKRAAIACGIINADDSDKDRSPIQRIKMYWKRANAAERKELLQWLKTSEAKQKNRIN